MIRAATEKESHLGMSRFLFYGMVAVLLFTVLLVFPVENAMGDACSEQDPCYRRLVALKDEFFRENGLAKEDLMKARSSLSRTSAGSRMERAIRRHNQCRNAKGGKRCCRTGLECCHASIALFKWLRKNPHVLLAGREPTPLPGGVYSRWQTGFPVILGSPPVVSPDGGDGQNPDVVKDKVMKFYQDVLDRNDPKHKKLINLAKLRERFRNGYSEINDRKTELKKLKKSISFEAVQKKGLEIWNDPTKDRDEKEKLFKQLMVRKKEIEKQLKREMPGIKKALDKYEDAQTALEDIGRVEVFNTGKWQDQMSNGRYDQIKEAQIRWRKDHPNDPWIDVPEPVTSQGPTDLTGWFQDIKSRRDDQVHRSNREVSREQYKTEHNVEKAPGEK